MGTAEAPLCSVQKVNLTEAVRFAHVWVACGLLLLGLVAGGVLFSESGLLAAFVCFLLLVATCVVPTGAREPEGIQTGEVTRGEAIQNLTVIAGAIGLNSGIGGTSVCKPTA